MKNKGYPWGQTQNELTRAGIRCKNYIPVSQQIKEPGNEDFWNKKSVAPFKNFVCDFLFDSCPK